MTKEFQTVSSVCFKCIYFLSSFGAADSEMREDLVPHPVEPLTYKLPEIPVEFLEVSHSLPTQGYLCYSWH